MSGDHRAAYEVEVGGNVTGLDLFETALDRICDALPERSDCRFPALPLVNDHDDVVIHETSHDSHAQATAKNRADPIDRHEGTIS